VGVHWDRSVGGFHEGDFGRFYGILRTELEFKSVGLVQVDRVGVQNLEVEEPFVETLCRDERDSGWEAAMNLLKFFRKSLRCECHIGNCLPVGAVL